MVEYQVGDTIFELLNNSSEKFSRAQAWILPTEYTECQAFCPVVRIGSPLGPGGRNTRVRGRGWGTQFRRRDRHSCTVWPVQEYYNLPHRGHRLEINATA